MEIDNIELEYFIDYINNKMHLLDSSLNSHTIGNLPNVIGTGFQKKLIEKENLLIDVIDFEWICYCPNGVVMAFKDYNLKLISKKLPWLHKPFLTVSEDK